MTTFMPREITCAVCGEKMTVNLLASTNTFGGGPDLDGRPGEMARSTMFAWVQMCPVCGYAAQDISQPCSLSREILQSEGYKSCEGLNLKSPLAQTFYRQYMLLRIHPALNKDQAVSAMNAALHAAWACDDERDVAGAVACREKALQLVQLLLQMIRPVPEYRGKSRLGAIFMRAAKEKQRENTEDLSLLQADLMRRSGQFDALLSLYEGKDPGDSPRGELIAFELEKAKVRDDRCYTAERRLRL